MYEAEIGLFRGRLVLDFSKRPLFLEREREREREETFPNADILITA